MTENQLNQRPINDRVMDALLISTTIHESDHHLYTLDIRLKLNVKYAKTIYHGRGRNMWFWCCSFEYEPWALEICLKVLCDRFKAVDRLWPLMRKWIWQSDQLQTNNMYLIGHLFRQFFWILNILCFIATRFDHVCYSTNIFVIKCDQSIWCPENHVLNLSGDGHQV